ncbi:MAG: hypothetical protein KF687_17125 [Cyclobacteriaceae bacterium]|nr:hypothetical protein [Cyclobacteriaceae bacterium]
MKNLKITRVGSLVVGILTAAIIVISQVFFIPNQSQIKSGSDSEQQDATPEGAEFFSPSAYSLPSSSTTVVLNHDLSCIEEILFGEPSTREIPTLVQRSVGKLFKALFQFIIAPNAP